MVGAENMLYNYDINIINLAELTIVYEYTSIHVY